MKRMRIQQGLAMVEFTIILPVLLILLLSILELGRAFYLYSEQEKLSRNSTRYLANVIGSGTTGVYSLTDSKVANASNLIVYGTISTGNNSLLPSLTTDHVSVTFSNNYVQVEVAYPFQPVLTTLPNFFSGDDISLNFTMTSSYTMRGAVMKSLTLNKKQGGITIVEFSIVAVLFFIIIFAIIEFGRLMFTWHVHNETSRRTARLASVCQVTTAEQADILTHAIVDKVQLQHFPPNNINIKYLRNK